MINEKRVQLALRKLWTERGLTPEDVATMAGVNRATVYRIAKVDDAYSPRVGTVLQILASLRVPAPLFFASVTSSVTGADQGSGSSFGGSPDVLSSARRITELETELAQFKARWGDVQDVARRLFAIAVTGEEGGPATDRQTGRRKSPRKAG